MGVKIKNMTAKEKKVRNELLSQLKTRKQHNAVFEDVVDDYIVMMRTRSQLQEDIEKNGPVIEYQNGANQKGVKKNDSLELLNKTRDRMIKTLLYLGISPKDIYIEEDDDEL